MKSSSKCGGMTKYPNTSPCCISLRASEYEAAVYCRSTICIAPMSRVMRREVAVPSMSTIAAGTRCGSPPSMMVPRNRNMNSGSTKKPAQ